MAELGDQQDEEVSFGNVIRMILLSCRNVPGHHKNSRRAQLVHFLVTRGGAFSVTADRHFPVLRFYRVTAERTLRSLCTKTKQRSKPSEATGNS